MGSGQRQDAQTFSDKEVNEISVLVTGLRLGIRRDSFRMTNATVFRITTVSLSTGFQFNIWSDTSGKN